MADLTTALDLVRHAPDNRCQFRKHQCLSGQWAWTLLLPSLTEPLAHGGPYQTAEEADAAIRLVCETSGATEVEMPDASCPPDQARE